VFGQRTTFNSYIKNTPIADYFSDIVSHAFEEYIEDVRQTIWKKIMKNKDKIIKEYYKKV